MQIPKICEIKRLISLSILKKPIRKFDGEHYWETGKAGYSVKRIVEDVKKVGFKIKSTYGVFETPYHRFFLLKKTRDYDYDKNKK